MTILLWSLSKSHREPYNAGGHAKRRDTTAGIFFCYSTQVYSVELVAAGSSYKAMLSDNTHSDSYESARRYGYSSYTISSHGLFRQPRMRNRILSKRMLAGNAINY